MALGCNGDDGEPGAGGANGAEACTPAALRGTCVEDLTADYRAACWDGRGACTWSRGTNGETVLEWANGTRVRFEPSPDIQAEIHSAAGSHCTVTSLEDAACTGVRYTFDDRQLSVCFVLNAEQRFETARYLCDDDEVLTLPAAQATAVPPMCAQGLMDPLGIAECKDSEGRRFIDQASQRDPGQGSAPPVSCPRDQCSIGGACHPNGTRNLAAKDGCNTCECRDGRALCTQGPCGGDIGARCYDDAPCKQGFWCRNTYVDDSMVFGFCAASCEETSCPAGTACTGLTRRDPSDPLHNCLRTCTSQADCDPFGSRCHATAGASGYCN